MSEFFSCLLLPGLEVRHSFHTNSHTELAAWLGLPDDQMGTRRRFLRAVVPNGDMAQYAPDEDDLAYLPTWYAEQADGYRDAVAAIVADAAAIHAKRDTLYAEYEAKRDTLDAEYRAKCAPLYAEYEAKRAPLYAEYGAKCDTLDAEYRAKCDTLDEEYATIPGAVARP